MKESVSHIMFICTALCNREDSSVHDRCLYHKISKGPSQMGNRTDTLTKILWKSPSDATPSRAFSFLYAVGRQNLLLGDCTKINTFQNVPKSVKLANLNVEIWFFPSFYHIVRQTGQTSVSLLESVSGKLLLLEMHFLTFQVSCRTDSEGLVETLRYVISMGSF